MKFGAYIQRLREAAGMSLSEAARELGMSPQRLCDIEQGRRNFTKQPSPELLKNIAALYNHPFASLVTNTEFFQYEKTIIADLLAELEPMVAKLEKKTLEMLIEAQQYTPEMEGQAVEAHALMQALNMALLTAKTRYSRAPKGKMLDAPRTRKAG